MSMQIGRRDFIAAVTAAAALTGISAMTNAFAITNSDGSLSPLGPIKHIKAGVLDVGYHELGDKHGVPVLLLHGELDKRVPIPNSYELRQALEDKGVPVKMVVYKGFGHGITKPREERAVAEHNYEWFSKWIWGESVPNGMLEMESESR